MRPLRGRKGVGGGWYPGSATPGYSMGMLRIPDICCTPRGCREKRRVPFGWGFLRFFKHLRFFGYLGVFGVFPEFGAEEVGFFIKREFFHGIDFINLRGVFEGRLSGGEFKAFASELQSADFQVELEELGEGFEVSFFDGLIHEFDQAGIESGFNDGQSGERGGCHSLKTVRKRAAGYGNKYGNSGNHGKKAAGEVPAAFRES